MIMNYFQKTIKKVEAVKSRRSGNKVIKFSVAPFTDSS